MPNSSSRSTINSSSDTPSLAQIASAVAHSGLGQASSNLRIAFIGGGNMAQALGLGLIESELSPHNLLVIDPSAAAQQKWQAAQVATAAAPGADLAACQVWVLAVKPQLLEAVLASCRPFLQPNTLVLSVAAGLPATQIAHWLGTNLQPFERIVRCMPNTPALVRQGVTGMMALEGVSADEKHLAERLLQSVGQVVWVADDAALDAVTALSGSGPAYVFLFLEALIQGGIDLGLSPEQARGLALQTVSGAAQLARDATVDIAQLRANVTSEGGTTAAALAHFEQQDFSTIVRQAMHAAAQRAAELADEFSSTS